MKKNKLSENLVNIDAGYIQEPLLSFNEDYHHVDPKTGIISSAPKSFNSDKHPSEVKLGFIGLAEIVNNAKRWIERGADGMDGSENYIRFPGFKNDRGFRSRIRFSDDWNSILRRIDINDILEIRNSRERFEKMLDILKDALDLIANKDSTPDYIIIALSEDIIKRCRTADYLEKGRGLIHRDLRRAIKAIAMKYRIPTQILLQETVEDKTGDEISKIYWNFFTGLYFKSGGFPWGPVGLQQGTCYIGISFFHPLGDLNSKVQTSLVQAFDDKGDGLVLRGHEFIWDKDKTGTNSPHLSGHDAFILVDMVLNQYQQEMKQNPRRVVVHKTSRFWTEEKDGFVNALRNRVNHFDLVAMNNQSTVRLIPTNKYPPLRGTFFSVGNLDYLYTTGYITELKEFHGLHVPSPIYIADHIGHDTSREELLNEILILTKMNWNSAKLGGLLPITIRFSRRVGDIMREISNNQEPLKSYRFYM